MAERCMVCNGTKTYAPMGGIQVKCIHCEGLGYVSDEKASANRLMMQVNKDTGQNPSGSVQATMSVNVPINPIIAPNSTISGDPLTVTTNEIEAIKAKMIADNAQAPVIDYASMDKRTSAYKAWKANNP